MFRTPRLIVMTAVPIAPIACGSYQTPTAPSAIAPAVPQPPPASGRYVLDFYAPIAFRCFILRDTSDQTAGSI
jgi:hypothetical protein